MDFINSDYLVSSAWLADHLDDANVRILDVTTKLTSKLDKTNVAAYDASLLEWTTNDALPMTDPSADQETT